MLKHQNIISKMTLEEKCYLLSGKDMWQTRSVERLGVRSITLSDGPNGVRRQEGAGDQLGLNPSLPATCFPTAATVANSWDPNLGEEIGQCLGEEAACQNVAVLLGPGLNIKRSPLCGRNFEYFSEDPYLAGKMAAGYVRGIQANGVSACPKHFAANSQELRRMASDSIVDERTLREIYLTGFEIVVKEGHPKSLMTAYNRVNGVYANENEHLLQEILRDEWGFDGFVVSDWGASNDHVEGVRTGSHLEMPTTGGDSDEELIAAVKAGKISEDIINKRADELLDVMLDTRKIIENYEGKDFDKKAHHKMAQKAAEESLVLLKNEGDILPLKAGTKVALIGDFAMAPRYQGAGSSMVNATEVNSTVDVIGGFDLDFMGYSQGYPRGCPSQSELSSANRSAAEHREGALPKLGEGNEEMRKLAVQLAEQSEVVLLYLGLDEISESEGLDRSHMRIPQSQIDLLNAIYMKQTKILSWCSRQDPRLRCHGCQNAEPCFMAICPGRPARAALRALTGQINPSGKLAETFPISCEDAPCTAYYPSKERNAEYREGLYVGYRYYTTVKKPVRFPFGYGLSYTTFEYSDLKVSEKEVSFTLKNTGKRDGAEIAQLYVHAEKPSVYRPTRELKGFAKTFLKAGESRRVTIALDDKAFRYFNTKTNRFEIDGGRYLLQVGASVEDIRLAGTLAVNGSNAILPDKKTLPSYERGTIEHVSDEEWTELLGNPIPDGSWSGTLTANDAICQLYYAKSAPSRLVYRILTNMLNKSIQKGKPDLNIIFIYNIPFRGIGKMAGGLCSQYMVEGILKIVNGHFFKGLGQVISGFFKQRKVSKKAAEMK